MTPSKRWLVAFVTVAACSSTEPGAPARVPMKVTPATLVGADAAAAWALLDRDVTTGWGPLAAGETAEIEMQLDAEQPIESVAVLGGDSGRLELVDDGGVLVAADLADLRAGWSTLAVTSPRPTTVVRLRLTAAGAGMLVRELELWGSAVAPSRPLSASSLEALYPVPAAEARVPGEVDVADAVPSFAVLDASSGGSMCASFELGLARHPGTFRRAWLAYRAQGLFRPFGLVRSINDGGQRGGDWIAGGPSERFFSEPVDPETLSLGSNELRFCIPPQATGPVVLAGLRLVAELDDGTRLVDSARVGSAEDAAAVLDGDAATRVEPSGNHPLALELERVIAPRILMLDTTELSWTVACRDESGAWTPVPARSEARTGPHQVALTVAGEALGCSALLAWPTDGTRASVAEARLIGSGARRRIDRPQLFIASPPEHFGRVAWVDGWARDTDGLTWPIDVTVDETAASAPGGVYGALLSRTEADRLDWPVTVSARFGGGRAVSRQVVLTLDSTLDLDSALTAFGVAAGGSANDALSYGPEGASVSADVKPDRGGDVWLASKVGVTVPSGAVDGTTTVTVLHLGANVLPPLDAGMVNVTSPADHGYEFLPHGQRFKKAVRVVVPFDPLLVPEGQSSDDVETYYYDSDSAHWRRLARDHVDEANGVVHSLTDHFTIMINATVVVPEHPEVARFNPTQLEDEKAADPGAGIALIAPPEAASSGEARLSYPLEIPPGRNAMQPQLTIVYNSSAAESWLGVGWDLPVQAVGIDTRWGVPRYDPTVETETYVLDGEQLTPLAHRGAPVARSTDKVFHSRVERDFRKIVRHGSDPTSYWWEVVDKRGTRSFFGGEPDHGVASDAVLTTDVAHNRGNVFRWALVRTIDTNGNTVDYTYRRIVDRGVAAGTVDGHELYLAAISYTGRPKKTGPYEVAFFLDRDVGGARRPDVAIDGRGGFKHVVAERLRRVDVSFDTGLVRRYELAYTTGAFGKSLLGTITQRGSDGTVFPGNVHRFSYFDLRDEGGYGFGPATDWNARDDKSDLPSLLGIGAVSTLGDALQEHVHSSALSGTLGTNVGGHLYVGFNALAPNKYFSFGFKVGGSTEESEGILAFIDVDGDGLPDKVFRDTDDKVWYRKNLAASGTAGFAAVRAPVLLSPGGQLVAKLSKDSSTVFSLGAEAYVGFNALYNHAEGFVSGSTYLYDVNGDGIPDLVNGGQVLFGSVVQGAPTFTADSTETPVPVGAGAVAGGLLPDLGSIRDQWAAAHPLEDTMVRWVAPYDGTVEITAPVSLADTRATRAQLGYTTADGVRVAIQQNDAELWATTIGPDDVTPKTPSGVSAITVLRGDRIYFRVQSIYDGAYDQVVWQPRVAYLGVSAPHDANDLDPYAFARDGDFTLAGRPGINVQVPYNGTVCLGGDLYKNAVTSDDVAVVVTQNQVETFASSLAWSQVGAIPIDFCFPVTVDYDGDHPVRRDEIALRVAVDSPIDVTALSWQPRLFYTDSPDVPTVTDTNGNPLVELAPPYHVDIYPASDSAAPQTPWVVPASGPSCPAQPLGPCGNGVDDDGDGEVDCADPDCKKPQPGITTITVRPVVVGTIDATGTVELTVKERLALVDKQPIVLSMGSHAPLSFDVPVTAGEELFFDFSVRDPALRAAIMSAAVFVTYSVRDESGGLAEYTTSVPRGLFAAVDSGLFPEPYRGWAVAGYNGGGARALAAIDEDVLAAVDASLHDPSTYDQQSGTDASKRDAFPFAPFPRDDRWRGDDELAYAGRSVESSSRLGQDYFDVPSSGAVAGAAAVPRLSHTSQDAVGGGFAFLSGSGELGSSTSLLDFLDMNGDRFPDVVTEGAVQYTAPTGALEATARSLGGSDGVRKSTNTGLNLSIGANPSFSIGNAKGRVDSTTPGTQTGGQTRNMMLSIGFSGGLGVGATGMEHDLVDVNGDGLPDRVSADVLAPPGVDAIVALLTGNIQDFLDLLRPAHPTLQVALNLGYGFAPSEPWGEASVSDGDSSNGSLGLGLGANDGIYGWGFGASIAKTSSRTPETLVDINGDGLADRVRSGSNGALKVSFNTGAGFSAEVDWTGALDVSGSGIPSPIPGYDASRTELATTGHTVAGGGGYFTIAIGPLCLVACYVIINPGAEASQGLTRQEVMLADIDGDGYADHLRSEVNQTITVASNRTGKTNLLKQVERPLGGTIALDYTRTGNTYDQPENRWALSKVTFFDGLAGDSPAGTGGADYQLTSYSYAGGRFDRLEREFLGFSEVAETRFDTRGLDAGSLGSAPTYRRTTHGFRNDSFYTKGLLASERIDDVRDPGTPRPYSLTANTWFLRDVDTHGAGDPTSTTATLFPELARTDQTFYEGSGAASVSTYTTTTYDELGNETGSFDAGDTGTGDDTYVTVTYTSTDSACSDLYVVGKPTGIVVTDASARVLRRRAATYDCAGGTANLTQVTEYLAAGDAAVTDLGWTAVGNLDHVVAPANHAGERYWLDYGYDPVVEQYVTSTSDSFGYTSSATWVYALGKIDTTTDSNGNVLDDDYDVYGRLERVTGPYEIGVHPYTLSFEYHPEATVPYAVTEHLDPERDLADPIETILFVDGFKRAVQTKTDATVHRGPDAPPDDVMIVSGRVAFDHLGRVVSQHYPTTEPKSTSVNRSFDGATSSAPPTRMSYDAIDRLTSTVEPDGGTTAYAYSLAADRHGASRFTVAVTDPDGNVRDLFRDVRRTITAQRELDTRTGEVIWTEYAYDPLRQITGITDTHGNATTIAYDELGRRTLIANPDTGPTAFAYDPAGNLVREVPATLAAVDSAIVRTYRFNQLQAISYPLFPENDVLFDYGGPELLGAGGNRVGRITRVTDQSGIEEREYGKLGELTKQVKTVASFTPGHTPERYTTEYSYDTWGRLHRLTYPDGEVLVYDYDSGGRPRAATGTKDGAVYPYVTRVEYDQHRERVFMELGNGVRTTYAFGPLDRRLALLTAGRDLAHPFQNLAFTYDQVGNVTRLSNDVPVPPPSGIGGPFTQQFEYDSLYRLVKASGTFSTSPRKTDDYALAMSYDGIHNILAKSQSHTRTMPGGPSLPQRKTSYELAYDYGTSGHPHAASRIGDREYRYDPSGNQLGWDDVRNGQRRTIVWDEENRIQALSDNGRTTRYKYDEAGERVIKRGRQGETAYVNQYWTVRNATIGTKHVFVGSTRVASKLAPLASAEAPPALACDTAHTHGNAFGPGHSHGQGFGPWHCHGKSRMAPATTVASVLPADPPESHFLYFYHPDHLSSSEFVTDHDGELYRHTEYFPFGEEWVDESTNTERTPYLFAGKELDEETGLYYFGARYYDPRTSVWESTDPALGKFLPRAKDWEDSAQEPARPGVTPQPKLPGGGGVFASANLGVYGYAHNNVLRVVDDDGSVIKITGSATDIAKFIDLVKKGTGVQLKDDKGTLVQVGARDPKVGSALAAKVITDAIASKDTIDVATVNASPTVFIDSYATNKVDVADLEGFYKKSTRFGASALVHIIQERAYSVAHGTGYGPAHASALVVESKIMGAANRTAKFTPGMVAGATLDVEFQDKAGKTTKKFTFTLDANLTPK